MIKELQKTEILLPIILLALIIIAAPMESTWQQSYTYISSHPVMSVISVLIFAFGMPRILFIIQDTKPSLEQSKVLCVLSVFYAIMGLYILK